MEQYVTLPALGIPEIGSGTADVEDAAQRVREEWGVPAGPVRDVVALLETHGVVTARFRVQASKVDAFSMPLATRPLSCSAPTRDTVTGPGSTRHTNSDISYYTGACSPVRGVGARGAPFRRRFLMPADDIAPLLPTRPDWRRLLELKATWHVSLAALLMRAKTLGVMSDTAYLSGIKAMSAKGWRKESLATLVRLIAAAAVSRHTDRERERDDAAGNCV